MNTSRTILIIVYCFFILNCSIKKKTFFNSYKEFKITTWGGENFVSWNRKLKKAEREKLKNLLDDERIVYKDTLNAVYIRNDAFYDKPELLFSSFTDFLLDSNLYNREIRLIDSIQKLNQSH